MDYLINEIVGILRYSEMVKHRIMENMPDIKGASGELATLAMDVHGDMVSLDEDVKLVAITMIEFRTMLKEYGFEFGEPEHLEDQSLEHGAHLGEPEHPE